MGHQINANNEILPRTGQKGKIGTLATANVAENTEQQEL